MATTKRAVAEFIGTFWLVLGGCGRPPGNKERQCGES